MSAEKNKDTLWRLEDQKWWQEYSAMIQRERQQNAYCVPGSNYNGSGYVGSGSNTSGLYIHGSNTSAYGSGLYIHGSNTNAYGSGLYIHGSNTSAYGSGLFIHGSNTSAYGSGLYIHGSNTSAYGSGFYFYGNNAEVYGTPAAPVQEAENNVDLSQVLIPEYLRKAAESSAHSSNNKAGVLAYGLDLI